MALNWGGGASGAIGGATAGAPFGPVGAGIGGVLGGLSGLFGGGNEGMQKYKTLSKEQQKFHQIRGQQAQQLGQGGYQGSLDILQQMLNPQSDIYRNFEAPYRREFEEQTIPNLAERFAGMGAQGGALSSSGFGQSLGAAGAGLQEKLAYLKSGLQQSAIERLMNQYNSLSQGYLNTPEFAYANQQGGVSPLSTGTTSAIQNITPGSWQGIMDMFSKSPQTGGGYNISNMSPGGMAQYDNLMNQAQNIWT